MSSPGSPAEARALIIERLVGDTGEPDHVVEAARGMAQRALPAIADGLAHALGPALRFEVASVELARLASAKPTVDNHAMTVAASASSPDALILTMDADAVAIILSAAFGADADAGFTPISRGLSPIETEIASSVFEEIAKAVNGSGARAFAFKTPLPAAVTGEDLNKLAIRDGPAARVVFSVATPAARGDIVLTMPQRVLLKHRGDGAGRDAPNGPAQSWRQRFSDEVMRSNVELSATMPLATMTLGQLAGLQPGQVIELQENAQAQARLSARQKTLFVCEFGKLGQNYTVRVRHPFDAGQELMDGLMQG